tara:strand:+ start:733 stop:1029 length:297 start_codon:yes stop_codon:yes gene_type:complete
MDKKNIIDGYKGIMPLDLTDVDAKLHSILIKQHYKDIDLYKIEQAQLPEKLRYENTIMRAEKIHKMEENARKKRVNSLIKQQVLNYQKKMELYYKYSN